MSPFSQLESCFKIIVVNKKFPDIAWKLKLERVYLKTPNDIDIKTEYIFQFINPRWANIRGRRLIMQNAEYFTVNDIRWLPDNRHAKHTGWTTCGSSHLPFSAAPYRHAKYSSWTAKPAINLSTLNFMWGGTDLALMDDFELPVTNYRGGKFFTDPSAQSCHLYEGFK